MLYILTLIRGTKMKRKTVVALKQNVLEGQGDGSVTKLLLSIHEDRSLDSQHPCKELVQHCMPIITRCRRQRQGDPWALLATQLA